MATITYDVKIISGSSVGPYTIYFNDAPTITGATIADLSSGGTLNAINLTLSQLNTGNGVRVNILSTAPYVILYNNDTACILNNVNIIYVATG